MITVEKLTEAHCRELARNLRSADRIEMVAMLGAEDAEEARTAELLSLLNRSGGLAKAGLLNGRVVNAWGVVTKTDMAITGHPWMLATDLIHDRRFRRAFARRSRDEFFSVIPRHIRRMWNMVDVENETAIRWLKWLNFQFMDEPIEHGGIKWFWFGMEAT